MLFRSLVRLDPAPAGWFGTYQRLYDGMSPGVAYEAVFSGELEPITTGGGGEGEKPVYTFTVYAEGTSGEPEFRVRPEEQVVCVGKGAEFIAEKRLNEDSPWVPKVSNWSWGGEAQPPAASSKTLTSDEPGIFTVTAEANGLSDSATLTVVKAISIQPNSMPNLQEIDDGDGNPKTRIFVVPIAESMEYPVFPVTVRATITPSISESQLPAGSTLQGGTGSEKLTRTISRTISAGASKTEFTFTCGGVDSGLKTTVYVYDAKVGLFANEGDLQNIVGHSWGRYSLDAYTRELIPWNLRQYLQEIGFWPSIAGSGNCAGDVRLGAGAVGGHWPSGWKEYPIYFSSLSLALPQVKASDDSPPWYNLFNYNCTDYAIGIGEIVNIYTMDASGVSTPWAYSSWLNTQ